MSGCKKTLCLLLAALMALMSLSTAFCAAAEDAPAANDEPLTVQVEMSKSSYFVGAKAKATVRVQNNGTQAMRDVAVSVFSNKHQLCKGDHSCFIIPELGAGESKTFSFEMVLNRKRAGVSFFEGIFLFFAQMFRSYDQMEGIPHTDDAAVTQEVKFRHGSVNAVLEIDAWHDVDLSAAPQTKLLDKYVYDVFYSDEYTMEIPSQTDPIVIYANGNNFALEIVPTSVLAEKLKLHVPKSLYNLAKLRFVLKGRGTANAKAYCTWFGGYCEVSNADDINNSIKEQHKDLDKILHKDLEYAGLKYGVGYLCESYINREENTQYNFYFSKLAGYEGLVRYETVDLSSKQTDNLIEMRLEKGVTSSKAFEIKGIEFSLSVLEHAERLFS